MSSAYSRFIDRERHPQYPHNRMQMTQRDLRILEHIHSYGGVLSAAQLLDLEFRGTNGKACHSRLTRLFHNGFLARTSKVGTVYCEGTVYWLTGQGAREVAASVGNSETVSQFVLSPVWAHIRHDLRIVDVVLKMQRACSATDEFTLSTWLTEHDLRVDAQPISYISLAGIETQRKVIPDAYLQIERQQGSGQAFRSRLLLEIDFSTHPHRRFADYKVLPGIQWIKSADYKRRFGAPRGRWLVVTKSERRLKYLKETTERVAGKDASLWSFTTFEQLSEQNILTTPIWQRGGVAAPVALFPRRDK